MQEWNEPVRQSPAAMGILLFRYFREAYSLLIVMVIGFFRKEDEEKLYKLTLGILLFLTFGLLRSVIRYLNFRFFISDGNLIVNKGGFRKKQTTIPLSSIQSVHIEQHAWHRMTGTARLVIDSPGTEQEEVAIDAIGIGKAGSLREIVLSGRQIQAGSSYPKDEPELMTLSFRDLIVISLTRNHLQTLAVAAGFIVSFRERILDIFGEKGDILQYLPEQDVQITLNVLTAVLLALIVIVPIVSFIITVLKYHGLRICMSGEGFDLRHGLISTERRILPIRKIQVMIRHSNMLRRWLGLQIIECKTAAGLDIRGSGGARIPVINGLQANALTSPFFAEAPSDLPAPIGMDGGYVPERLLKFGLPVTILLILFAWTRIGSHSFWCLLLLPLLAFYLMQYQRNFRFWVTGSGIIMKESVFGVRHTITRWEKIQQVTLRRSFLQYRSGYADVILHTAGGNLTIPGLSMSNASLVTDLALAKVETSRRGWM
jgi:putative membrane protein